MSMTLKNGYGRASGAPPSIGARYGGISVGLAARRIWRPARGTSMGLATPTLKAVPALARNNDAGGSLLQGDGDCHGGQEKANRRLGILLRGDHTRENRH